MSGDIIGILELRRYPIFIRVSASNFLQFCESKVYIALTARRIDHFRTVGDVQFFTLLAHAYRHYDNTFISLYRRQERAGYPRVSRGAFKNCHSGSQISPFFRFLEHLFVYPVLQAPRHAVPFYFAINVRARLFAYFI